MAQDELRRKWSERVPVQPQPGFWNRWGEAAPEPKLPGEGGAEPGAGGIVRPGGTDESGVHGSGAASPHR